jgi:RimJ/RimL family protein N-acetyltransferase
VSVQLELRPATLDDAVLAADLETRSHPDDPFDAELVRHRWTITDAYDVARRDIALDGREAIAFVGVRHEPWDAAAARYGTIRPALPDDAWTDERYASLVRHAESWLREEGAATSIVRTREDSVKELGVLDALGYREVRRARTSELDLVARREHIQRTLGECRRRMRDSGVALTTLDRDPDPEKLERLYRLLVEAEADIPTSTPWRTLGFDEWRHFWFDSPGIREDRLWTALEGSSTVGMTAIEYPVRRAIPYTAMTGTARAVRGRGIARALKYEAMNQAIELGFTRVRTQNDADNAPILRINAEMGYRLVYQTVELHHVLTSGGEAAQ